MKIRFDTRMRAVTFKLEEELLQELDLYAINNNLDRSSVIRKAIEFYLKHKGE